MRQTERGMTLLESAFALAIAGVMASISVPMTKSFITSYRLDSAVTAVSGAIQMTRYEALMHGAHYRVRFTHGSTSYQVASQDPDTLIFTNAGNAVLWCTTNDVSIGADTTLEFYPNGTVVATAGSTTLNVTNGQATETITVSTVGNVSVSK